MLQYISVIPNFIAMSIAIAIHRTNLLAVQPDKSTRRVGRISPNAALLLTAMHVRSFVTELSLNYSSHKVFSSTAEVNGHSETHLHVVGSLISRLSQRKCRACSQM